MIQNNKLTVVIPCYNEREGLLKILNDIPPELDEVLVVDNNSNDDSGSIAQRNGARVVFEARRGYGRAYKTGLQCARGDIICTMDGDGSYNINDALRLARYLLEENLDFVSGSRFPLADWGAMHLKNFLGNIILTAAMAVLFGLKVNDSQSGMWVLRRGVLEQINPQSDGMPFSEEIKLEAFLNSKLKCAEIHIGYVTRMGKVKLNAWRDGWRNLIFLIGKRIRKRRSMER